MWLESAWTDDMRGLMVNHVIELYKTNVIHYHLGHPTIQATFPPRCNLPTSTLHYSTKKQYLLNLIKYKSS